MTSLVDPAHYQRLADLLARGMVVPFLGAGVNACDRDNDPFVPSCNLPTGGELAKLVAERCYYERPEHELARVSQYLAVVEGPAALYDLLHDVFDHDYPPTSLHRLLAELPGRFRQAGNPRYQLIVTMNYDDTLEQAFADAGEPVDVVIYIADGPDRGRFLHIDPEGEETVVEVPNKYDRLSPDERTVIVKIHGAVNRREAERDSYVITEDHYIDYLTRTDISSLIPVRLASRISRSHFLFLGYSLRDWNLRVILHRIWGEQKLKYKSWAIQLRPSDLDREFWELRGVDVLDVPLDDYVGALDAALDALLTERAEV